MLAESGSVGTRLDVLEDRVGNRLEALEGHMNRVEGFFGHITLADEYSLVPRHRRLESSIQGPLPDSDVDMPHTTNMPEDDEDDDMLVPTTVAECTTPSDIQDDVGSKDVGSNVERVENQADSALGSFTRHPDPPMPDSDLPSRSDRPASAADSGTSSLRAAAHAAESSGTTGQAADSDMPPPPLPPVIKVTPATPQQLQVQQRRGRSRTPYSHLLAPEGPVTRSRSRSKSPA
jgi:hypothetical protein